MLVACSTALRTGTDLWLFVFDVERLLTPRLVGELVAVGALVGGLAFAAVAWRRRHLWMARLSIPLVAYAIACAIALAAFVAISQPPSYLARAGLGELRSITEGLDVRHMISYFGFAVVAAFAWRTQVSLLILGVLLMGYGFGLELLQEFIPTRNFLSKDLVSNGLGILLGLCWAHLYHWLFGDDTGRAEADRQRRALAVRNGARASVQSSRS